MDSQPDGRRGEDNAPLLGALLRMPHQAMMATVEPGLADAGYADVRPTHIPILQTLSRHPRGLWSTELAARARITKQSMGALVDYLAERGYVERVPDPSDGRAWLIRLADRGWGLVETSRRLVRQTEAAWADLVGTAHVEELRRLLTKLVAALDNPDDQRSATIVSDRNGDE